MKEATTAMGRLRMGMKRGAEMEEEDDDDEADDDGFFDQVALQGLNGGVDQAGAVITGDDFDAGGSDGPRVASLRLTPSMTSRAFIP